jgi:undecaprenyl diphosphate synthase
MDGNGRWARKRGLPRTEGHLAGAQSARTVAEACIKLGIPYLTLYAFSTENWQRPAAEVRFLMKQLRRFLIEHRDEMVRQGIRLQAIGRLGELPPPVVRELQKTVQATEHGAKLTLTLALNYGGRSEIVDACRSLAADVKAGKLDADDIDEKAVASRLYTAGLPDPDLLIRTGGEMRLSNFLLWQVSYTELYVTEVLWPDFNGRHLAEAIRQYSRRERRFGALTQQTRGRAKARGKADTK